MRKCEVNNAAHTIEVLETRLAKDQHFYGMGGPIYTTQRSRNAHSSTERSRSKNSRA